MGCRLSKKELNSRLSSLPVNYKIIEYAGRIDKLSTILDPDYGVFKTKLGNLFQGHGLHPERKKTERAEKVKQSRIKAKETCLRRYGVEYPCQSEIIKNKSKQTCTERYGVDNPLKSKKIKEKAKKTLLKNYGVEVPSKNKEIVKKIKKTNLERYGVEVPSKNKEIVKKIKKTNLEKYGCESPLQNKKIRNKSKKTWIKKYGVDNPSKSKEIIEKIKNIMVKTYDVEHPFKSPEIQKKIRNTLLNKYGVDNPLKNENIKKKVAQTNLKKYGVKTYLLTEDIRKINDKVNKERGRKYKGKKISEWAEELDRCYSGLNKLINRYGFEKAISLEKRKSGLEILIEEFLTSKDIEFISQFKVENYAVDIYIPKCNLIIELDGLYWHSELYRDKQYHKNKRKFYLEGGYIPLFFRENEIKEKFNIVTSMIENRIGINQTRIYARKCQFKEINKEKAKEFINNNHLMGSGSGKCFGLFYKNELVSIIQFKYKNKTTLEVSRYCSKLNYVIIGGLSKLLKNSLITYTNINKIVSYVDNRYGNGNSLLKLGFTKTSEHLSFKWTNGSEQSFNRGQYKGNSGYDYGLVKIWDCGQSRYEKVINV